MQLTQAILPVAGLGTRFLPWTKAVPKELLPLGTIPIIAYVVEEVIASGIHDICFILSSGKEAIPKYFQRDLSLEEELQRRGKSDALREIQKYDAIRFTTLYQKEQLGDGHAIREALEWITGTHAAVLFSDDLFLGDEPGLVQLFSSHRTLADADHAALVALEAIPKDKIHRYGIAGIQSGDEKQSLKRITKLVEKPKPEEAPSNLGIVGRYILPRTVFETLNTMNASPTKELRIIDALTMQLPRVPIYGYACKGTRIDIGTPEGYREALKCF